MNRVAALRANGERLALVALGLLVLFALVHLYRKGQGGSFWFDEWDFVLRRRSWDLATFLEPHNEHLSLVPILVYKALFEVVGLDQHGAYRLVLLLLHLTIGVLVFAFARPRVGGPVAVIAAALILFLGAGYVDFLWAFQIGFLASLAAGLGALLALERGNRAGDAAACVLIAVALASSSLGIPIAAGAAAYVLWGDDRRSRAWIFAVPIALYALWYLGYGVGALKRENLTAAPPYVAEAVSGAAGGVLGLSVDFGRPLAVIGALLLFRRLAVPGPITRTFAMLLAVAGAFWVLTALARAHIGDPVTPRYLYPGGLLVILILVEAARPLRPSPRALAIGGLLAIGAVLSGLGQIHDGAGMIRNHGIFASTELAAVEIARDVVSPDFYPNPARNPQLRTGPYLAAVADYGSSPAYSEAELEAAPEDRRTAADEVLVRAVGLKLGGADQGPEGGEAPVVDRAEGGVATSRGGCIRLRPGDQPAAVELTLPPAGVALQAAAPADVSVRRFADGFANKPIGSVGAGGATLRAPRDRSSRPWHVRLGSGGLITACTRRDAG